MARLIADAAELSDTVDAQSMSFANIVEAIHVVQKQLGIAGATSKEAATTISGSLGMLRASWQNVVMAFSDNNASGDNMLYSYIQDLVDSASTAFKNLLPVVQQALTGITQFVTEIAPVIVEKVPEIVQQVVPALINGATEMVNSVVAVLPSLVETVISVLVSNAPLLIEAGLQLIDSLMQSIQDNKETLLNGAFFVLMTLTDGILNLLPDLASLGLDILVFLADGISKSLPKLIPTIAQVVVEIVNIISENFPLLLDSAIQILEALAEGIISSLPVLLEAAVSIIGELGSALTNPELLTRLLSVALELIMALVNYIVQPDVINGLLDAAIIIVENLVAFLGDNAGMLIEAATQVILAIVEYFTTPENVEHILAAAFEIVGTLAGGLIGAVKQIGDAAGELLYEIFSVWETADWLELGTDIVNGIKSGIEGAWNNLSKWFKNLFGDLIGIAKKILGIASPSKVFKGIGKFTAEGFGLGFDDEFGDVKKEIKNEMDFGGIELSTKASQSAWGTISGAVPERSGTRIENVSITISGAQYQDEQELAEAIAETLQNMTDRKAAIYGETRVMA